MVDKAGDRCGKETIKTDFHLVLEKWEGAEGIRGKKEPVEQETPREGR